MVNVNTKNKKNTENTKMIFFINWLHKNGAEFPNLHIIHQKKNERGVKTSGQISKNKTVIKIPRKLLIYSDMGKNTKWGQQLQSYTKRKLISPDIIYILIYMIKRMNTKAFHRPYFDILPRDISHFPIFWNKSDLKYLENSHLLNLIKSRKDDLNYDYTTLCLALDGFKEFCSWGEFMWLRSIIGSRNFGISIKNKKQAAMVPLSDMLNHSMKPDVNWHFNNTKDAFVMESNKALSSNQEISDSYGSKCNSRYLLYYGFALHDGSEKDRNTILFEISQQILKGRLYAEKLHFIKSKFKCTLTNNFSSVEFNNLMRFLRISNANRKELEIIKEKLNIALNPINKRNECAALSYLALHATHELNKYPLSIHQNKANLRRLKSYSNASFATKLVIGEKEILTNIIEFSKMSLEVLLFKRRFSPRKLKNNMKGYILLLNDMN
jgi:histone-lysine N-methyltransferase SETD3